MKNIAILASGNGSNAEAIARYFADDDNIRVAIVISNRAKAFVHERMAALGIPTVTIGKDDWETGTPVVELLRSHNIDLIVLAGFMRRIHDCIIEAFPNRIINIHPSLLPSYGGPGMWGHHVHEAVLAAGETQSGITIHHVTTEIDCGEIIFQASCPVNPDDTPDSLADRIHILEHRHYPQVVRQLLS